MLDDNRSVDAGDAEESEVGHLEGLGQVNRYLAAGKPDNIGALLSLLESDEDVYLRQFRMHSMNQNLKLLTVTFSDSNAKVIASSVSPM